ncbi:MAG: VPLPA-CTERM sorting domain-containing protein [Desulfuromonadales bacterium]|nr:VPLPA-CTERM sorting domain-containing protein [Desulfuromonadales bacterium]
MKSYKKMIPAALLAVTLVSGSNVAHAALGVDFNATTNLNENGGPSTFGSTDSAADKYTVVGWSFRANTDLYLTRLGVYDSDKDRLHNEDHKVGIWSASSQSNPLATATLSELKGNQPTASAIGQALFHWSDNLTTPIILHKGETYYVGATTYSGAPLSSGSMSNTSDFDYFAAFNDTDGLNVSVNQNITYLGNAYAIGHDMTNSLIFPGSVWTDPATGQPVVQYTVGANIDVTPTPIPAAAYLLGSGLLGLAGIRRKNG